MRIGSVASDDQKGESGITFAQIPKNGLKYRYDTHGTHVYLSSRCKKPLFCVRGAVAVMWFCVDAMFLNNV